jgi:hypothetical protein
VELSPNRTTHISFAVYFPTQTEKSFVCKSLSSIAFSPLFPFFDADFFHTFDFVWSALEFQL